MGILISFFLPWQEGFFVTVSGYDLSINAEGIDKVLGLLVPITAAAAVIMGVCGANTKFISIIAGSMTVFGFASGFYEHGKRMFEFMEFGAYICLILGVVIIFYSISTPTSAPEESTNRH